MEVVHLVNNSKRGKRQISILDVLGASHYFKNLKNYLS